MKIILVSLYLPSLGLLLVPFSDLWATGSNSTGELPGLDSVSRDVNGHLRQIVVSKGLDPSLGVGERVPDFALFNQEGEITRFYSFRGEQVIMSFIFTRCAMLRMCPATTRRMKNLQQEAKDAGLGDLRFLSVSFDPEYDSPVMLKQYAENYEIDTSNFSFLTGPKNVISDVLSLFGIRVDSRDGTLDHSMATVLIDDKGRVSLIQEGPRWSMERILEKLKEA